VYFRRLAAALERLLNNMTPEGADDNHVMTLKQIHKGLLQCIVCREKFNEKPLQVYCDERRFIPYMSSTMFECLLFEQKRIYQTYAFSRTFSHMLS
jgi:hypothetical protein